MIPSDIFETISDKDSVRMLEMVVTEPQKLCTAEFKSRKRYYSRLSKLKEMGLIKRYGPFYEVTAFGSVVYDTVQTIRKALDAADRLQTIDAMNTNKSSRMPEHSRRGIIESLIPDEKLRRVLLEGQQQEQTG